MPQKPVRMRKVNAMTADGKVRVARANAKYDPDTPVMNGWVKVGFYSVSGWLVRVEEELEPYCNHLFQPKGIHADVVPSWEDVIHYINDLETERILKEFENENP